MLNRRCRRQVLQQFQFVIPDFEYCKPQLGFWNAETPKGGPETTLRMQLQLLFPK